MLLKTIVCVEERRGQEVLTLTNENIGACVARDKDMSAASRLQKIGVCSSVGHGCVFCNTWGSLIHEPRPHCQGASPEAVAEARTQIQVRARALKRRL